MPRNISDVYAVPAGTRATTQTTIDSADYNAFLDDLTDDLNLARPIVAGGTGATSAAAARANLGTLVHGVEAIKTGDYTVVPSDIGKTLIANKSSAIEFTMSAAATLGSTFAATIKNIGAGVLTVTPDGSETIDGASSLTLTQGSSVVITSNGTTLRTLFNSATLPDPDYDSGNQSFTSQSLAHGLGVIPAMSKVYMVCSNGELGYLAGEKLELGTNCNQGASDRYGVSVGFTDTYAFSVVGLNGYYILNKSTREPALVTASNWKFRFLAWL